MDLTIQSSLTSSSGASIEVFGDSYYYNPTVLDSIDQEIIDHGYHDATIAPPRNIIAAKVSLPAVAGTANLLDVLPPHLRDVYSNPLLLRQPPCTKLVSKRAFMCQPTEYVALIKRMMDLNMLSFTQQPMAINGMFAVDKDAGESLRLIIDARRANSMSSPPPSCPLPTPDLVAKLQAPHDKPLYTAKVDLDNFYHRLRLPDAWHPWFALPPIRVGDPGIGLINGYKLGDIVYPCCATLPMGWSHSVFLAQAIHEHLIDTQVPGLPRADRIIRETPPPFLSSTTSSSGSETVYIPGSSGDMRVQYTTITIRPFEPICILPAPSVTIVPRCPLPSYPVMSHPMSCSLLPRPLGDFGLNRIRHSVYIDDLNIYGTDPVAMSLIIDNYLQVMSAAGLPAKPKKVIRPTADGMECLGIHVNGRTGDVGMSIPKLQRLKQATDQLLVQRFATGRQVAAVVGRWNWAALIRRPAMAVFSAVYRFIDCARDTSYRIWPSVYRELWTMSRLAPLLSSNIRSVFAPIIIASDASELACGVVYRVATPSQVSSLDSIRTYPGQQPFPPMVTRVVEGNKNGTGKEGTPLCNWKIAISHRWRHEEHINGLEVRSALAAFRWSLTKPSVLRPSPTDHTKLLLLCDSSATVGSMNKGRSSSHNLLRPLRSITSLVLATGITIHVKWIPTGLNPADAPSRQ